MTFRAISFHTTQYDLNFYRVFIHSFSPCVFPYYIVRFKHFGQANVHIFHRRFHTTQYDLNRYCVGPNSDGKNNSFHTTQYDLNHHCKRYKHTGDWFPYYIVRFKPDVFACYVCVYFSFHTTQYDLNPNSIETRCSERWQFPYYIVRFKLSSRANDARVFGGFPYYIVRFKPHNYILFFEKMKCFHTTQYDLNCIC